jgi:shikimate dehydrogenase
MADMASRAFVCGHPVANSRSSVIRRYWLKKYRITGFERWFGFRPEVTEELRATVLSTMEAVR